MTLTYGSRVIAYTLERAERKTLAITVQPDQSVLVRAPVDAADEAIERILRRRASWVLRQQRFFAQFLPRTPERQYVGGETHLYLGRQYRLRIHQEERETVKLAGGHLCIFVQDPADRERVRRLLDRWYLAHAQERFRERLAVCMQAVAAWQITEPRLQVRRMAKRWGSCTLCGTLILNVDLIRAPRACIDYVITHELCHLRHPHHSPEFYQLLSSVMPDWEERKQHLERRLS